MLSHMWSLWDFCSGRKDIHGFLEDETETEAFHEVVDLSNMVWGEATTACSGFARDPQYCQDHCLFSIQNPLI